MKFLNLILYSTNVMEYVGMQQILSCHLKHHRIEHYFYYYDPLQTEDIIVKDNMISLRGTETYIPGILEKTLKVFKYFQDKEYDYIVRSNISTLINFKELERHIGSNPLDYGGTVYYPNSVVDLPAGLTVEKNKMYGSRPFATGLCIVLSKRTVKILVNEAQEVLSYGIIDDVAIGIHLYNKVIIARKVSVDKISNAYVFNVDNIIPGIAVYRNNTHSRTCDVIRMNKLALQLR